ncbi:MAG TPA: radical SAM protein [Elusimicrobiota bacterium]|nr:radical SAM protein [Elusimicrobiota bacterium]
MRVLIVTAPVLNRGFHWIGPAYLKSFLQSKGNVEAATWNLNYDVEVPNSDVSAYWQYHAKPEDFYQQYRTDVDAWVDRILAHDPDILGFSVWGTTKMASFLLAEKVKKRAPRKPIVFGGFDCSLMGEQYIQNPNVDAVVRGEGELTLLEMAEAVRKTGAIKPLPGAIVKSDGITVDGGWRPEIEDINELPFPDYSDYSGIEEELPLATSRGCMWRCRYCNVFWHMKKARIRSAENLYAEMRHHMERMPRIRSFGIGDANGIMDIAMWARLSDLIIADGRQIPFSLWASLRPRPSFELLKKMRRAGCRAIGYGIETGSARMKKAFGKAYFTMEEASIALRDTHDADISTSINVIVGFPGETEEDFDDTLRFIEKNARYIGEIPYIHIFRVIPKSPAQKHPLQHNLGTDDWEELSRYEHPEGKARAAKAHQLIKSWGIRVGAKVE